MYPPEASFTIDELEIIFRIRQLIGDEKETFVDDFDDVSFCDDLVKASGTMYQLRNPKGYPVTVLVDGIEYASTSGSLGLNVLGYKFIQFTSPTPPLADGASLLVVYDHFRNSDLQILNVYDTSATTYLVSQCNLSVQDLGVDLLILATAYVLLTKDLSGYIEDAVKLEDSDSILDASRRPQSLQAFMKTIQDCLKSAIEQKKSCKMLSLPIYKVE